MKRVLAILLAFAPVTLAADEIAWGAPVDGFRLGVTVDQSASPPVLRVLIENRTVKPHNVLVNAKSGTRMYPLAMYATSPDGKQQYPIVDSDWNLPIIGPPSMSVYARLEAGATYEYRLVLTDLIRSQLGPRTSSSTDLATLLQQGFTVHVSADLRGDPYGKDHWKLLSGEF